MTLAVLGHLLNEKSPMHMMFQLIGYDSYCPYMKFQDKDIALIEDDDELFKIYISLRQDFLADFNDLVKD